MLQEPSGTPILSVYSEETMAGRGEVIWPSHTVAQSASKHIYFI